MPDENKPVPAPDAADNAAFLKRLAQLEQRLEAAEAALTSMGADLDAIKNPAKPARKPSRFFRED